LRKVVPVVVPSSPLSLLVVLVPVPVVEPVVVVCALNCPAFVLGFSRLIGDRIEARCIAEAAIIFSF
jgi:hypothetical protein